jgi:hypothetical protein
MTDAMTLGQPEHDIGENQAWKGCEKSYLRVDEEHPDDENDDRHDQR